jgi:rubredoxin
LATHAPKRETGAVFSQVLKQCQSVPNETAGALTQADCEAQCFRGSKPPAADVFGCTRCAHVYNAARDGNGVAFEALPDTWQCPECGAPKSAYAKVVTAGGAAQWVHHEGADAQ